MDYQKTLAMTGGGITLGAVVVDQGWLIGAAVGLIAVGALAIRLGFRRNKEATEK